MRTSTVARKTKETDIFLTLNLDGTGNFKGGSGIGFFDHMLNSFAVHSGFDLSLDCTGDLQVDCHHTIEDIGIVLGKALGEALGQKAGILRYGDSLIPMDEALARAVIDVSGRPFLVFSADFSDGRVGDMDSCMVKEFFRAVAFNAGLTLHLSLLYGENTHHGIEALFKAFAHALKESVSFSSDGGVLSAKGALE